MLHASYAPFSKIFPRAAVVIHHGGIGTCAQAMAAGVPQVVMPLAFDQFDNAARLQKLGLAVVLPAQRFTARRAAMAIAKAQTLKTTVVDRMTQNDAIPQVLAKLESLRHQASNS
jgi:UDP:flavonoid glycosyltransferase YjiC (YdhE family)